MTKIKLTKNELKAQRDSLKRFQRYLPTLQLKKQQLQMELRQLSAIVTAKRTEEADLQAGMSSWVRLYTEELDLGSYIQATDIRRGIGNIAGVAIPVFEGVDFAPIVPDLLDTPVWMDEGLQALERLICLRLERRVLEEQHRLLSEELRTTNQRVNLFEKVKIPQAKEAIRVIRIYLGDQMTAGVARSKIAKGKSLAKATAELAGAQS